MSASELQDNLEVIFPWCYLESDVINRFKHSIIYWSVASCERVKILTTLCTTVTHLACDKMSYFSKQIVKIFHNIAVKLPGF